ISGGQTTPAVQPPEVAKGVQSIFDGAKLDVYSAGVTLYFMLTGHVPFSCQNVLQIFEAIVKACLTYGIVIQLLNKADKGLGTAQHSVGVVSRLLLGQRCQRTFRNR
ncbi:unnamed protein product, partial [Trichobilharzia regenti]